MDKGTKDELLKALGGDTKQRTAAIITLASTGDVSLLGQLLRANTVLPANVFGIENSGYKVQQALYRLALNDRKMAMPFLAAALNSEQKAVRQVAGGILEQLGETPDNVRPMQQKDVQS